MTVDASASDHHRGLLDGVRVVDLTDLRGALCARILADLGADVVRIERPGSADTSVDHRFRNANKRAVRLDPATPVGRARFDELLAQADVLVDNVDLARRVEHGVDPDDVARRH
ncbi:MAG TPA: CoA transferase, partial [Acidimicrobiales bacterium]